MVHLHESLVTGRYLVQVIGVVIVVTAGAEKLESEITWNVRMSGCKVILKLTVL